MRDIRYASIDIPGTELIRRMMGFPVSGATLRQAGVLQALHDIS